MTKPDTGGRGEGRVRTAWYMIAIALVLMGCALILGDLSRIAWLPFSLASFILGYRAALQAQGDER